MNDDEQSPTTAQITVWRNLLDAFGQLNAAWESAKDAQAEHIAGAGPAYPRADRAAAAGLAARQR